MPLNKLDNFIKNTEGRLLYVNPYDLDSSDSISNQGNSLASPFKTVQRALLEAARFSYVRGSNNDLVEKTTILLFPGVHTIDNRPGFALKNVSGTAKAIAPSGTETIASETLTLDGNSVFDLAQEDNILYKFNSINGGVIVPRGTSIVGLDLRKTKIKPKYVPNPTDSSIGKSAIFRITGACYFWQMSFFDGEETGLVYTDNTDFSTLNQSKPRFSHHKLTVFEYADGVNVPTGYDITDLDMYYSKLSNAFNLASGRNIDQKYPDDALGFKSMRPEYEIVGAFASDPVNISNIVSGDGITPSTVVTVTTASPHNLITDTPVKINGLNVEDFNISTKVQNVLSDTQFTYLLPYVRANLPASPSASGSTVTIETDTVSGASPYIFNCSLRSVYGMNGVHADGKKATGFRSVVLAQYTGISLQKDDRAFVKYNQSSRSYEGINISKVTGATLTSEASSTNPDTVYHLDSDAVYRNGWESTHIKCSNDAFIQVVSVFGVGFAVHFEGQSGGDQSITNSNSNFGQFSLRSEGFKKDSFAKDNTSFITSIVAPRALQESEEDIDWVSIDVGLTTSIGKSNQLYLYGFTSADDAPPSITQGYRVGARSKDKLYVNISGISTSSANIYMTDTFDGVDSTGSSSSKKELSVNTVTGNKFTFLSAHNLKNGEKVRIFSSDADYPENLNERTLYYTITTDSDPTLSSTEIKLATSANNAALGNPITVYGGSNLYIISSVSDKNSGDIGSPVQFDTTNNNWFIHTDSSSNIYQQLSTYGTAVIGERTETSFIKRIPDTRSLDEKIYKLRVVVPKEVTNSRDPVEGFVIQESSTTGVRSNLDFTLTSIASTDYQYNRNPKFISTCSTSSNTVTVISELPHNLNSGDQIVIKNVTSTTNASGTNNIGFNGTFEVSSIVNDLTFTHSVVDVDGITHSTGSFTNDTSVRSTSLPRFERNDLKSNYFIYRNEVVSPYIEGVQDGVYHLYVLNSGNAVSTEFTDKKYSQNIVDLYPQLDRDNINDNPSSSKTFAKRSPLGEVSTNDLKKSITRETTDLFVKDFSKGIDVSSVAETPTSAIITFAKEHGLSGIVTYSTLNGGSGHTDGTYYNVKLYNNSGLTSWDGATSKVVVSSGSVTSANIQSPGSGYVSGETLYFDTGKIGGSVSGSITLATSGISTNVGDVIQFTGAGTTSDSYYRISSVNSKIQVSVARTSGDPSITSDQYGIVIGPSVQVTSSNYTSTTGITTFTCNGPHGLLSGNKFRVIDSSNNNLGDYIVKSKTGVNSFNAITNASISPSYVLKHGLSSNDAISDSTVENLGTRNVFFYGGDSLVAESFTSDTQVVVSSPVSGISTTKRFPLGSYIQIDNEIMRITSSTLSGSGNNEITVVRGALGTTKETHQDGSLINKIETIPVEFRRPTILRASGHTFEYLGYGPGNYSTGLPQVQVKTLNEDEEFLVQSQETSCGSILYSGMSSRGDFYLGNKKTNSATGQEKTFKIPVPTITGQDASRLSVVFDEVIVKERLLVEGGNSGTVLSEFDGPVTFNKEIKFNDDILIRGNLKTTGTVEFKNTTQSTSKDTGAVVVEGGVGIEKNLYVGGNSSITGDITISGNTSITGLTTISGDTTLSNNVSISGITTISSLLDANGGATIDNIRIGVADNNEIDTSTGNLTLDSAGGTVNVDDNLSVSGNTSITGTLSVNGNTTLGNASSDVTTVNGDLNVTQDITAFYSSDSRLKESIAPIADALIKIQSISGNTYEWNEISGKSGEDVGVIAQEVEALGLPGIVTTRDNGYLAVDYQKLVPVLIEALKELSEKVDIMERKLIGE